MGEKRRDEVEPADGVNVWSAIQIRLTDELEEQYDIYYRVHAQTYGWLGWAKNGESAGTEGLSKRLEGIEIVLVEKCGKAPGSTENAFVKK